MKFHIASSSVRVDDDGHTFRCLVGFPDLDTGVHGIQLPMPVSKAQIEAAVLSTHAELTAKATAASTVIFELAALFDKDLDLVEPK